MTTAPLSSPPWPAPALERPRPPYGMAAGVSVGALILYILTLAPTTQFWDASEYITAAHALGIPHPPGNPFFVIVAHVWGLLPLGADYAQRINLLAAVTSALSAGLWFLIGERWLRETGIPETWRRVAALAGALVGATVFTVWNQSVANEKVYTISVLSIALILWLTIRWADQPPETRSDNLLVLIVYLLALTATNQLMGLLVAPAVLVYVLTTDARALLRPRFWAAALVVAVVGLSVNLFIPIRAQLDPYMNQGDAWTWPNLRAVIAREQFAKPSVFANPMYPPGEDNPGRTLELIVQQMLNYTQYLSWQFGRDWSRLTERLLTVVFGLVGLLGALRHWGVFRHWRADRRSALAMTTLIVTVSVALVFYLNFKWGYSQPYSSAGLPHEVRERDYFFIASFAVWGIWVGMGLAAIAEALAARIGSGPSPNRAWQFAAPVFLVAIIPLLGNRLTASRKGETVARDFARDLLASVDPYALVVTTGDNDTFPLWHAQEVEGFRRDVSVMVLSLANTNWYLSQLQRRKPVPYPGVPAPTVPWMSQYYLGVPPATDTLPQYVVLQGAVTGSLGRINIQLDPAALGRPYIDRSELALFQIIRDQAGKRPIYLSTSTGNTGEQLGLGAYLVGEGLVRRLSPSPVVANDSIQLLEGRGFVNVPRTKRLAFEVYSGGKSAARRRPRGWVDAPSQNSLIGYVFVYDTIAAALREREPALATRALAVRDSILANTTYSIQ
jgi:transmembrane protein TMEM260 (protein O-mannosyltransferase)